MKSRFTLLLVLATALTFVFSFGCKKEEAKTDEAPAAGAASTPAAADEKKDEMAPAAGEEKKEEAAPAAEEKKE